MNGTLLNRQSVRGLVLLKSGDVLELGAQRYRFESLVSQPPPRTPSSSGDNATGDTTAIEESDTRKMPGASNGSSALPPLPIALIGKSSIVADKRWLVNDALVTIGREPDRDVYLPDESVSRMHAQIVRQRDGYFIADLHSSNGTFLNGRQLTAPALLSPGDALRIGEIELRCEAITDTSTASSPPAGAGTATGAFDAPTYTSSSATQALDRQSMQSAGEQAWPPDALLLMQRLEAKHHDDQPKLAPPYLTPR